jgi:hypothetical protein
MHTTLSHVSSCQCAQLPSQPQLQYIQQIIRFAELSSLNDSRKFIKDFGHTIKVIRYSILRNGSNSKMDHFSDNSMAFYLSVGEKVDPFLSELAGNPPKFPSM